MKAVLAEIAGVGALFAGIVLALAALVQAAAGTGQGFALATALLAVLAFATVWACRRPVLAARRAAEAARRVYPAPLPAPGGTLTLPMPWAWWTAGVVLLAALLLLAGWMLAVALPAGRPLAVGLVSLGAALVTLFLLLTLEAGRRAAAHGGVAHFDAQGFRHWALPPLPWQQVRAIYLEPVPGNVRAWNLVFAVDPAFAGTLSMPVWPRILFDPVARLDRRGRVSMAISHKHRDRIAGRVVAIAQQAGVPAEAGLR